METPKTLIEYLEHFMNTQRKLSAFPSGKSQETINTYQSRKNHIVSYLAANDLLKIKPAEIKIHLVENYYMYLIEKGICNNYAMRCIQFVGMIMKIALRNGDILINPVQFFNYHFDQPPQITWLQIGEIEKLKSVKLSKEHIITLDIFLFSCYTGLSFSDAQKFNYKTDTFRGPDNRVFIHIKRKKTMTDAFIPLLPEAEEILIKYNYCVPRKSNQKTNKGLKVIARLAGIKFNLTSHVGRKTFASILLNEKHVPLETVSRMLGHTSVKTTERCYCRTNIKKIAHDMQGISFGKVA